MAKPSERLRAATPPHGGFRIVCPECGADDCELDAFLVESMVTQSRVLPMPLIHCPKCDIEWNPRLTRPIAA